VQNLRLEDKKEDLAGSGDYLVGDGSAVVMVMLLINKG
jgi:hypothetical protein